VIELGLANFRFWPKTALGGSMVLPAKEGGTNVGTFAPKA
jgi:hypothetical protein